MLVGVDDAHFFPEGTQDIFKVHICPVGLVNTYGVPIYAQQTMGPKGKHVDIDIESNSIPICSRPGVLVKGLKN